MAKSFKITVLPGDGIGPEIIEQAVRILDLISKKTGLQLELTTKDFGGAAIDNHGNPLPDDTLKACQESDAVLFGAVGGPKWGTGAVRPEQGILKLRKELGLYANIRPASFASENLLQYSPLKEHIAKGVDIIVVRELIGGIYFGDRTEDNGDGIAVDTCKYSVPEIERITRVAARIALAANPPLQVTSLDKANVMATSRLWRKTFERVMKDEFPPASLNGVVVTENLFGDIISDETSVIPGSLGLLPSASLAGAPDASKTVMGVYEPIHGSAPDIAGQGIANPIGTILSAALMLRYSLGCSKEADAVEAAVRKVLDSAADGGYDFRTKDLGGDKGTKVVGDKILEVLETLL
ncbi:hypothetical protein CcaverHIS002_0203470 [Cutaneotrichosporon cavernicola]|nr:hypothetical protein CcaverHIS002_0203470 [Cutaneotrichosporon cavernicola]